jgi:hypothetical protein
MEMHRFGKSSGSKALNDGATKVAVSLTRSDCKAQYANSRNLFCRFLLCITIGEIRLLQHEISSLTQRRKDFFLIAAVRWRNGSTLAKAIQLRAPSLR